MKDEYGIWNMEDGGWRMEDGEDSPLGTEGLPILEGILIIYFRAILGIVRSPSEYQAVRIPRYGKMGQ